MEARKAVWDLFIQRMQALNISESEIKKKRIPEIKELLHAINFNDADKAHVIAEFENIAFIAQRVPKPLCKHSSESSAGAASTPEAKRMVWNKFNMKMQELGISATITKNIITEFKDLMKALEWDLQALSELEESLADETPNPLLRVPKPSSKNGFGNRMSSDDITQTKELPPTNLFPADFQPSLPAHQSLIDLNIPDHDAVVEWCRRQVEDMRDSAKKYGLTDDEVLSVVLYTYDLGLAYNREENIYFKLNHCLRSQTEATVKWRDYLWYLLNAMQKLPKFKGEVYRGINANLPLEAYKKGISIYLLFIWIFFVYFSCAGKQVRWGAFTSTSILKSVAENFMSAKHYDAPPFLFVIEVSGGCVISEFSAVPDEAEVLLPPECSFKVAHLMDFSQPTILVMHQAFDTDTTTNLKPLPVAHSSPPRSSLPPPADTNKPVPPATPPGNTEPSTSVPLTSNSQSSTWTGKMLPLTLEEASLGGYVQSLIELAALLSAAPKSIMFLSKISLLCTNTSDFQISKIYSYPLTYLTANWFHACLLQIVNHGLSSLDLASKLLSEIRTRNSNTSKTIQHLASLATYGSVKQIEQEISVPLEDVNIVATTCFNLAKDTETQFTTMVKMINEGGQMMTFCRSAIESREFAQSGITEAESEEIAGQLLASLKLLSLLRRQWTELVQYFSSNQIDLQESVTEFIRIIKDASQKKAANGKLPNFIQQQLQRRASRIAAVCVQVNVVAEMYLTTFRDILELPLVLLNELLSINDSAQAKIKQNEIQIKCETAVVADKFTNPVEVTANFKKQFAAMAK